MDKTLLDFVKPELLILVPVMYILGIGIKKWQVRDKWIPFVLGITAVFLCGLWVFATSQIASWRDVLLAIFTILTQGVLVAGASVYINQLIKQAKKEK